MKYLRWTGILAAMSIAGCATYHPLPLPIAPDLVPQVTNLEVNVAKLHLPGIRQAGFSAADGLDMTEVAILAVVNDPALRTLRANARLGHAQAFAAGLLPDPQLDLGLDHPTDSTPGLVTASNVGLAYNINALVTHGALQSAGKAHAKSVDLQVLWAEWQVAQQARVQYTRCVVDQRKQILLQRLLRLYRRNYARARSALADGDITLAQSSTALSLMVDAASRLRSVRQDLTIARHQLNELLGLAPDASFKLQPGRTPGPVPATLVDAALATLPQRRPDLVALQAGYHSQEEKVRTAILAQFPGLSVGINRARDTSNIHTTGFSISLNLPFFNGNRGQIAEARATRALLWQDYQQQLDTSINTVKSLQAQLTVAEKFEHQLSHDIPKLRSTARQAQQAYARGDMDAATYMQLRTALLSHELEQADLKAQILDGRIALLTLLGEPQSRWQADTAVQQESRP